MVCVVSLVVLIDVGVGEVEVLGCILDLVLEGLVVIGIVCCELCEVDVDIFVCLVEV